MSCFTSLACLASLHLLILLFPLQATATTLTLDECLSLARKHNPVLRLSRLDTGIAMEAIRQSDAALYPKIEVQGGYTAQLEAQAMNMGNQTMETQQPDYLFGSLSIHYILYDFGRRDARRSMTRANLDAVRLGIRYQEQETALQVVESYLAILEAQKNVTATAAELHTVEEHRRVAKALYEAGSVTRNDLLQAEVHLATTRQQLLVQRNQVENLYLRLNFLTGSPPADRPQLSEPITPARQKDRVTINSSLFQQRPDLHALRKGVEISEQELQESRSAFYPELFTRVSLDYLENSKLREQTLYGASVGIRMNLFDGFSSTANRSRAVAVQARAREQVRLAEEQIHLEVTAAANDLQVAFERIDVTRESIRQGEENVRINQNRYQERAGTATEVLDAQTLLTRARTEHYRAIYDYQRAAARLRKATGEL